jgi:hypothetical protein
MDLGPPTTTGPARLGVAAGDQQPLTWQAAHSSPSLDTMVVQPWVEKWAQGLSAIESLSGVHWLVIWCCCWNGCVVLCCVVLCCVWAVAARK